MCTQYRRVSPWIVSIVILIVAVGFVGMSSGGNAGEKDDRDNRTVIVIDAGHGGDDPGALGVNGVLEKDLNLDLAKLVYAKSLGFPELQVVLTRRTDTFLELSDRLDAASDAGASLYVSIHANAHSLSSAAGIETYVGLGADAASRRLAEIIQSSLVRSTSARDRGVRSSDIYIGSAKMPAVLVEVGFLTNATEAANLISIRYQDCIADAILSGILLYLEEAQSAD
ncbi:N-acetylmuramoyl-L-alanine amidase [Candidatus Bipolaricaulota bacterium]|nr:N-acetylmuramoyl-L-alanine amidase [Candidatus Bipolaricaulota bacterium]